MTAAATATAPAPLESVMAAYAPTIYVSTKTQTIAVWDADDRVYHLWRFVPEKGAISDGFRFIGTDSKLGSQSDFAYIRPEDLRGLVDIMFNNSFKAK